MRYYLIAGEASGDLHGSNLIRALKAEDPGAEFRFRGGDLMAAEAGTAPVVHYREGAIMGFTAVLRKAGALVSSLRSCQDDILSWKPDAVILIDYPGFNLRIARFCHIKHVKVFWYIAPKTWASRPGRNRELKVYLDAMYIVFPFEIKYFESVGVPFEYHGNPLVEAVDAHSFTRPCDGPYIALLPGSRGSEISRTMPVAMQVAGRLGRKVIVAGAPSRTPEDYTPYTAGHDNVEVVFGRTYDILKFADAAIINSGTASLEAALIGTPQVVCWSTSPFSAFIARKILHVLDNIEFISLGNLCLGREAFKELIQEDFTAENLEAELKRITEDDSCREKMLSDYNEIRALLGGDGASRAVARSMIEKLF